MSISTKTCATYLTETVRFWLSTEIKEQGDFSIAMSAPSFQRWMVIMVKSPIDGASESTRWSGRKQRANTLTWGCCPPNPIYFPKELTSLRGTYRRSLTSPWLGVKFMESNPSGEPTIFQPMPVKRHCWDTDKIPCPQDHIKPTPLSFTSSVPDIKT